MKKIMGFFSLLIFSILGFSGLNTVNAEVIDSNHSPDIISNSVAINEVNNFTNVVIFIKFQDESTYTAPENFSYYESLFNGVDVVSLRDYYLEVSYGQLDISSVFATPSAAVYYYIDAHDRAYYQEYDAIDNPAGYSESNRDDREHELLKNAVDFVEANNLIDDSVNLDTNQDGDIDSISFLISGEDEGWNSLLWPHKWSLYGVGSPEINGKVAYTYTFELLGNTSDYKYAASVGILAHETFHLISAPDLYHYYDYDWIEPIGSWGLMEVVNSVPNDMLGYMKYQYGNWIQDVSEITQSGTYTLYPLSDSGDNLYRINTGYSNEYVYLEYRDKTGLYESGLPDSGLLVYRVDLDYYNEGNVDGYYDDQGNPTDEVFIFRPGITDTIPPIGFEDFDSDVIDEDGNIDSAALSNRNAYDEMGNGTNISMFYSDGSLMDMKIYNVTERPGGYITFDVYIPPIINLESSLDSSIDLSGVGDLYLVDAPGLSYSVDITNIPTSGSLYYTLDGTTPDTNSTLYQEGDSIKISAQNNQVRLAVYIDSQLVSSVSKTYQFSSAIESTHNPYGNNLQTSWYINLTEAMDYDVIFNNLFDMEDGYDFLTINDGISVQEYTGTELQDVTLSFHNQGLLIQFSTDEYDDYYYGFKASVLVSNDLEFNLLGDSSYYTEIFTDFIDPGYLLTGSFISGYYVNITGTPDTNTFGDYVIQYSLYDENDVLIDTLNRTIHVVDDIAPVITLTGDETIHMELGDSYTELGATYTDNYDVSGDAIVDASNLDINSPGIYTVTYSFTDSSGNNAVEVNRTVIVEDTTAPSVSLNPSLDSIPIGVAYTDYSVFSEDLSTTTVSTSGVVDTSTVGTYIITYTVTDASGNETSIDRYVTVFDPTPEIEFQLGSAVTTISIGNNYTDGSCSVLVNSQEFSCDIKENTINTDLEGVYEITYSYTYQDIEYTYKRYVFVVDDGSTINVMAFIFKEEEVQL